MNESQISIADPRAEQLVIEKLIKHCNLILTLMRIGKFTDMGIAEVYDVLSGFRSVIHVEYEEKLNCGCKELREQWAKEV